MYFEAKSEEQPLTQEQEASLKQIVVDQAPKDLAEAAAAGNEYELLAALPRAAYAAFHLEKFELAAEYARQCLQLAPKFPTDWNYGNAIHAAHTVLGLLALERGDVSGAIAHLRDSGTTPGSPQLNSFGPSMQLAKALLRHGEFAVVREYLHQCRAFWKMGKTWLNIWEHKVDRGEIPNFFMHSYR